MFPHDLRPHLPALLSAFEQAELGVAIISQVGGELTWWYLNPTAAGMLGYTVDELSQIPVFDTVAPTEHVRVGELLTRIHGGHPAPSIFETLLRHRDGRTIPVELSTTQSPVEGGTLLIQLIRDLTERHHAHASRLEADRVAVVAALASGLGHEINNPLTYVLLHLRNLRNLIGTSLPAGAMQQIEQVLDEAQAGAERIRDTMRAFMTFARRPQLSSADVDMLLVTQAALRLVAPALHERARVRSTLAVVAAVRGDESRLGQAVLTMLLFAGADFSTEDVERNLVTVDVGLRDGMVVVEVGDNGHDLSTETAARVFNPSFSARGASVSVGLGVPRAIAAATGGSMTLTARPGGGAITTLRLPPVDPNRPATDPLT